MTPALQSFIAQLVTRHSGQPFRVESVEPLPSASLWKIFAIDNARTGTPKRIFAKVGAAEHAAWFAAEADGLAQLAAATTLIRIPQVIAYESAEDTSLLLLEWLDLKPLSAPSAALLGHALADLHAKRTEKFGLEHNNFIGGSPQLNTPHADWVSFWQHCRLLPQLQSAARNRFPSRLMDRGERLAADCGALFRDYQPACSLLHGDLWGGNVAQDAAGLPALFDPAVYYGDREVDIAMTELFSGFATDFYAAYHNAWPLDAGYGVRKNFYNLYHVLNHANLFAGDYVRQSEHMIEALLAELG